MGKVKLVRIRDIRTKLGRGGRIISVPDPGTGGRANETRGKASGRGQL